MQVRLKTIYVVNEKTPETTVVSGVWCFPQTPSISVLTGCLTFGSKISSGSSIRLGMLISACES